MKNKHHKPDHKMAGEEREERMEREEHMRRVHEFWWGRRPSGKEESREENKEENRSENRRDKK
ncbi:MULTISPECIES: hypothetical protein [Bacillaceae]|uniref:hypothetical protein n=1 Tax=Bacillaceae TaxID=186817 RepID=UPI000E7719F7|nr:hypothetical protein [Bacillus sp. PK3_68]RJS62314.1 hypothetical protein CJ483_21485 [Bacillus sp. PK3_68]